MYVYVNTVGYSVKGVGPLLTSKPYKMGLAPCCTGLVGAAAIADWSSTLSFASSPTHDVRLRLTLTLPRLVRRRTSKNQKVPTVGIEPTTTRLRVSRSTELS